MLSGNSHLNGDFENLLKKYEKLIWHIAHRYFNNNEDALDICQEAAIKIYKGLPNAKIPESGSLKSWVCAVTVNACLDELRKRKKAIEISQGDELDKLAEDKKSPSAEDEALARSRAGEIMRAISSLPEDQRTMIILRDMNGLSYQELSETAGIGVNTVKSRLSRAREALRKLLER
ncbi:MAG: RNA polymerase sigma factor [Clostridiales bacterium]|jgi:RNA polymerase sigma-70 factor (ECF subfamily)|nr:RNA polymerase sigma factor [Clostridiales bacterium]